MRVVSLLPSATEILAAVGGAGLLVGRSHECDHPPEVAGAAVLTSHRRPSLSERTTTSAAIDAEVTAALRPDEAGAANRGLYALDVEALAALRPDVILTQDLCPVCSVDLDVVRAAVSRLEPAPEIVSLDPHTIADVFDDVLRVGAAVGRERAAEQAMVAMREGYWSAIDYVNAFEDGPVTVFLEWADPPFVAGHWTPGLVEAAGGRHPLNAAGARSVKVAPEAIVAARPERVIVCPCGFDLERTRQELDVLEAEPWWRDLPAVRAGGVALVDGNQMFNRPGPRLVDAFRWLVGWLQDRPELIPPGFPWEAAGG